MITLDTTFLHASGEEVLFIDTIESQTVYIKCYPQLVLRCRKELTEQFEGKKRPDIAVYDFDNGKKLLLDITIAHPWAQNYISRSCTTAGFAAAERDRIKNNKYWQMSTDLGYLFCPFSLEVFVRLRESARETLKQVSRLAAPLAGYSTEEFLNEWRRRLSFVYKKVMQGSCPTRSIPSSEDSSHQGQTLVIQLLFAILA